MTKSLPSLLISYEETIPRAAIQPFIDAVATSSSAIEVESRPEGGPYASLLWLVPTAVGVYIAKSYFDGFLKEAGKDHYQLLKKGIGLLWSAFFGKDRAVRRAVSATQGKISQEEPYSLTFSIMAEANSGLTFKLLVADDSSAEEFNRTIAMFLEFLARYYSGTLDSATSHRLANSRAISRTLLVARDGVNDGFVFLDPITRDATAAE